LSQCRSEPHVRAVELSQLGAAEECAVRLTFKAAKIDQKRPLFFEIFGISHRKNLDLTGSFFSERTTDPAARGRRSALRQNQMQNRSGSPQKR
jgi:hypothetical protein